MANVNEGHRTRLRQRMMKEGLSGFQDHEILEMLLFQSLPRKDTNKLAHDLLNKFGNFANVLNASPEQLVSVKGISQVTACNLAMLKEVWARYKRTSQEKMSLMKLGSVIQYAHELLAESYNERLVAVFVDGSTNYMFREEYTSENNQAVRVDLKKIVAAAMRGNAEGVILFHCHVKGPCKPSAADFTFTEKLFVTLANMNIFLLEHLIFNGGDDYYSFFQENKMTEIAAKYKHSYVAPKFTE